MLGALLRCGRFLINNPLEVVCRLIGLISARALMPVVRSIVLPLAAVAVSMLTAAGCREIGRATITEKVGLNLKSSVGAR